MEKEALFTEAEAIRLIFIVMGLFLLVTGVLLVMPWDVFAPASIWTQIDDAFPIYVYGVGILAIVSGTGYLIGGIRGHNRLTGICVWLSVSLFALILAMRLITVGFYPLLWLYPLSLMLISMILALTRKRRAA